MSFQTFSNAKFEMLNAKQYWSSKFVLSSLFGFTAGYENCEKLLASSVKSVKRDALTIPDSDKISNQ